MRRDKGAHAGRVLACLVSLLVVFLGLSSGVLAAKVESVAIVAWKSFANYLNHVAETEVDFPIPAASVA